MDVKKFFIGVGYFLFCASLLTSKFFFFYGLSILTSDNPTPHQRLMGTLEVGINFPILLGTVT
jgi:hypothetical protein